MSHQFNVCSKIPHFKPRVNFSLVCNVGYYKNGDACVMCTGNDIKSAIGEATDCSADTECDGSSHVPNPGHTACGKFSLFE